MSQIWSIITGSKMHLSDKGFLVNGLQLKTVWFNLWLALIIETVCRVPSLLYVRSRHVCLQWSFQELNERWSTLPQSSTREKEKNSTGTRHENEPYLVLNK